MTTARAYRAPRRDTAAAQTRDAIVCAARECFEATGWAGTTIAAVARECDVSPKTIEALFATKANLLLEVAAQTVGRDAGSGLREDVAAAIAETTDAAAALDSLIDLVVPFVARSAWIALVLETASDRQIRELWHVAATERRRRAEELAGALLTKPGVRPGCKLKQAQRHLLIATDWSTYRTLTGELGLGKRKARGWIRDYCRRALLA